MTHLIEGRLGPLLNSYGQPRMAELVARGVIKIRLCVGVSPENLSDAVAFVMICSKIATRTTPHDRPIFSDRRSNQIVQFTIEQKQRVVYHFHGAKQLHII